MKDKVLIKIPNGIGGSFFAIMVIAFVLYVSGIRSFESASELFLKGGGVVLVIFYLTLQAYHSSWLLFEDKLLVKRPLRPFYNRFEFPLEDIEKVSFTIPSIGKLNPWVKVYCKNKRFKIYDFGFSGDRKKMKELLQLLKQKGILVEMKVGEFHEDV